MKFLLKLQKNKKTALRQSIAMKNVNFVDPRKKPAGAGGLRKDKKWGHFLIVKGVQIPFGSCR